MGCTAEQRNGAVQGGVHVHGRRGRNVITRTEHRAAELLEALLCVLAGGLVGGEPGLQRRDHLPHHCQYIGRRTLHCRKLRRARQTAGRVWVKL